MGRADQAWTGQETLLKDAKFLQLDLALILALLARILALALALLAIELILALLALALILALLALALALAQLLLPGLLYVFMCCLGVGGKVLLNEFYLPS